MILKVKIPTTVSLTDGSKSYYRDIPNNWFEENQTPKQIKIGNDCHHIGDLRFIIHLILQMKYLYHRMYLVSEKMLSLYHINYRM